METSLPNPLFPKKLRSSRRHSVCTATVPTREEQSGEQQPYCVVAHGSRHVVYQEPENGKAGRTRKKERKEGHEMQRNMQQGRGAQPCPAQESGSKGKQLASPERNLSRNLSHDFAEPTSPPTSADETMHSPGAFLELCQVRQ